MMSYSVLIIHNWTYQKMMRLNKRKKFFDNLLRKWKLIKVYWDIIRLRGILKPIKSQWRVHLHMYHFFHPLLQGLCLKIRLLYNLSHKSQIINLNTINKTRIILTMGLIIILLIIPIEKKEILFMWGIYQKVSILQINWWPSLKVKA